MLAAITWVPAISAAQQPLGELPRDPPRAGITASYALERAEDRSWTAPNPALGMHATFTADEGVRIAGTGVRDAWSLRLELVSWGRSGALAPVEEVEPVASAVLGRRVEYRRGPLTEWYMNGELGLQQGFTLAAPPPGLRRGALEMVLSIHGGFAAQVLSGSRDALFSDPVGGVIVRYSGLRSWDANGLELEASLALEGGQLAIRVDDQAAAYPVTIDPWIATEEAKLVVGDAEVSEHWGQAVAVLGDTALVGSPHDDYLGLENSGSVRVFERSGTTWTEVQSLVASDAQAFADFGESIALDGDTALIGDSRHKQSGLSAAGAAYVFVHDGTSWVEQAKLVPDDPDGSDYFGCSVALSGDLALIGAYGDDIAGYLQDEGSAYVFERQGTTWIQRAKLIASDGSQNDQFGYAVGVAGQTAVVGAPSAQTTSTVSSGKAYVFVQDGTGWSEQAILTGAGSWAAVYFGTSVAISGDTILVGAPWDDVSTHPAGAAYAFVRQGTNWTLEQKLTAIDGEPGARFGNAVALEGHTAVIGAESDDLGSIVAAGAAYAFVREGTLWCQQARFTPADVGSDLFGGSVALSGDTVVAGAPEDSFGPGLFDVGSASVFRIAPGSFLCTAGTSASGCRAALSMAGLASASAPSGFALRAKTVEGAKDGLFFMSVSGFQALPWGNGSSFLCLVPPLVRLGLLPGTGTAGACDGSFVQDLNAVWCPSCPAPGKNPGSGAVVQAQLWYRDPLNTSSQKSSLSDAVEFCVAP